VNRSRLCGGSRRLSPNRGSAAGCFDVTSLPKPHTFFRTGTFLNSFVTARRRKLYGSLH